MSPQKTTQQLRRLAGRFGFPNLFLTLCALSPALAQIPQGMPAAAALRPYRIPSYSETKLPNGLTVVFAEDARFPLVTARLVIPAGTARDSKETPGVAAAFAAMLMQGTGTRSARQLAEDLESCGCAMSAGADADSIVIEGSAVAEGAGGLLSIMGDVLRDSQAPEYELDQYRRARRQSLAAEALQPAAIASSLFRTAVFGSDPYSAPRAQPDSVEALDRNAMLEFHRNWFLPNESWLILAGKLPPHAELVSFVTLQFGGWPPAKTAPAALPAFTPAPRPRLLFVDRPGAPFAEVRVGRAGPAYSDPDAPYLALAASIVGGGSDSRLSADLHGILAPGEDVRTDVYGIARSGLVTTTAHVRTEAAADVLAKIVAQLARISKEPVEGAELSLAQSRATGAFLLDLESQQNLVEHLARIKLFRLPKDYLESWPSRIAAADPARLLAAAKKWMSPDQSSVVVVADAAKLRQPLEKALGRERFEMVDASGAPVKQQ